MIYHSNQDAVQEYFSRPELNQSSLKTIANQGMMAFILQSQANVEEDSTYYEDKEHFNIGSAVDIKLTAPEGTFEKNFHCAFLEQKPSDAIISITKQAFDSAFTVLSGTDNLSESGFNLSMDSPHVEEFVWAAIESHTYQPKWGRGARISNVIKNGGALWNEFILSMGKQVLSNYEATTAEAIAQSLITNTKTAWVFQDDKDVDILYQVPIYFVWNWVPCKALIDIIRIDHKKKIIYPGDIKTSGDYTSLFPKAMKKFGYYKQGTFYRQAILIDQLTSAFTLSQIVGRDLSNYQVADFAFIVESKKAQGNPLIFSITEELENLALYGDPLNPLRYETGIAKTLFKYSSWKEQEFSTNNISALLPRVIPVNSFFNPEDRNLL